MKPDKCQRQGWQQLTLSLVAGGRFLVLTASSQEYSEVEVAWAGGLAAGGDARGSPGASSTHLSSQVHIANQCEVGGLRLAAEGTEGAWAAGAPDAAAPALPPLPAVLGPDTPVPAKPGGPGRPRDPNTCYFEGQQRPHGARWAPNYDPLCSLCTCQVGCSQGHTERSGFWGKPSPGQSPHPTLSLQRRTVICDPVVCPPPSCPSPVQALDQCCPVCPGECPT